MISSPSPPPIPTPPIPPNPPILTTQPQNVRSAGAGGINALAGYGGSVQGNVNPQNQGQKTLLGQ